MTNWSPQPQRPQTISGAPDGYLPWLIAQALESAGSACCIARDDNQAATLAEVVSFLRPDAEVLVFPAWDCLPFDRASPTARISADRIAALHRLSQAAASPRVLITTINAVLQRVVTADTISHLVTALACGDRIDLKALASQLSVQGYARVDTVADAGDFAVRGGLIDLYPPGGAVAYRLDFFGDEIESIRIFDPHDQRSIGTIDAILLLPASEMPLDAEAIRRFRQGYIALFGGGVTTDPLYQSVSNGRRYAGQEHWLPLFCAKTTDVISGYVPEATPLLIDHQAAAAAGPRFELIADHAAARQEALTQVRDASFRPLPANALYLDAPEWQTLAQQRGLVTLSPFPNPDAIDAGAKPARDFAAERVQGGDGSSLYAALRNLLKARRDGKTLLACYTAGSRDRLAGLFDDHGLKNYERLDSADAIAALPKSALGLLVLPLENGFETEALCVLSEQDLLGERIIRRRRSNKRADSFVEELSALIPGDLVVHIDHGIGRYDGLKTIEAGGAPHDCVALSYAGSDKLYVPVENIDVLTRYGSDSDGIALDKLGGSHWQARRAKLKERIREIAGELLKVAAARQLREAQALAPQEGSFDAFCARFPYAETDDQLRAIHDVINDLKSGRPMDRLVCGDVGFGKTEVALRAAMIAAMEGQQVALICPTTLLARQHHANFAARFSGLPLKVGQLSRLVPAAESARVNAGLADGSLDIVIGTHALLAKKVSFKRLGLVIVDEEQHFGVAHKERLKQLKTDVHVLTLTATPIPRTLQMALSGLRELSIIATPPIDRLAVRTQVLPWDMMTIRDALLREHYRGGQSFFVVPRIADLAGVEELLRAHMPELKVVTAHGQMAASEIEDRMSAFYDRRHDVLLSTTIIESGLDIPNANTLIIWHADRFGLAQLYQLRGRVGRSKARGYAYLTLDPDKPLAASAEKRLTVLSSLDELGAGFQLASHDLDIRGAGNLLGDEQSGHIREVGFELYQNMLEEALLAARADSAGLAAETDAMSPQISVGVSIMIPESYVPDLNLRMALYRRLSDLRSRSELDSFAAELVDRFGALPQDLNNLIQVIEIKQQCRAANIQKIDAGPRGCTISFFEDRFANVAGLVAFLQKNESVAKLRPGNKLVLVQSWSEPQRRLASLLRVVRSLAKIAAEAA
jgi:transcription-repair coupling factor (superfamily II helicase)